MDQLRKENAGEKLGSKRRVLATSCYSCNVTHARATTTITTTTVAPCAALLVVNNGIFKCVGVFPRLEAESEATVLSDSVDIDVLSISSHPEVSAPSVPVVVSNQ